MCLSTCLLLLETNEQGTLATRPFIPLRAPKATSFQIDVWFFQGQPPYTNRKSRSCYSYRPNGWYIVQPFASRHETHHENEYGRNKPLWNLSHDSLSKAIKQSWGELSRQSDNRIAGLRWSRKGIDGLRMTCLRFCGKFRPYQSALPWRNMHIHRNKRKLTTQAPWKGTTKSFYVTVK